MIIDPLQQFAQANKGDISGSIWSTKNIDPQFNHGKLNISRCMGFYTDTADEANLGAPAAGFVFSGDITGNDRFVAVADDRVWETISDNPSPFNEVSGTPTDCDINSDITAFNLEVYIATSNNLVKYDGSSFSNISGGLGASPHSMTVYANRLYVSDLGNNVYSMDTGETLSKTGSNTIDLGNTTGNDQEITKIAAVSNGIWIATSFSNKAGGEMVFWDGETENTASARYQIPRGALAMTIKDDRPYILDSLGRLRVFDGTTFSEISRLPLVDEQLFNFNGGDNNRFIHPNGMTTVENEIYMLVRNDMNDSTQDIIENMPAGVWAWHPEYGLYHKYSFSNTNLSDDPVTQVGYGGELAGVGALFQADRGSNVDRDDGTEFLAGVSFYTDATTTSSAIAVTDLDNDVPKAGYLATAQIQAEQIDEVWQEVTAIYDKFKNSTDKIVVKYRTSEDEPVYATGTWSSDTILRSTDDLSTVEEGDEVEILRGKGAGLLAHIHAITGNYRIQLDENSLTGMDGTCRFRVQQWKKLNKTAIQDTVGHFERLAIGKEGAWIQIRVYMEGTGKSPQLQRLPVVSQPNNKY